MNWLWNLVHERQLLPPKTAQKAQAQAHPNEGKKISS
jgi:hypothetical protein